jgi:hypothetical protein
MTFASDTNISVWQASSRLTITSDVTATGKAISKYGPGALEMKNVRAGTLNINQGTVLVTSNGTSAGTSRVSALSIDSGSLSAARLDLANNSMIIDYSGASPLPTIRTYLKNGYADGAWNGANGIDSSAANAGTYALGSADNAVLGLTNFGGLPVTASDILIKYTYYGDSNLDGLVDIKDLYALASHWNTLSVWTGGDFNYDGAVNAVDLGLLSRNWQRGVGAPLGPDLADALVSVGLQEVVIPEPANGCLLLIILAAQSGRLCMRRRE